MPLLFSVVLSRRQEVYCSHLLFWTSGFFYVSSWLSCQVWLTVERGGDAGLQKVSVKYFEQADLACFIQYCPQQSVGGNTSSLLLLTSGTDGCFKVWRREMKTFTPSFHKTGKKEKEWSWRCIAVCGLRPVSVSTCPNFRLFW